MAQRNYRAFSINDDHLITHGSVVNKHYNTYKAEFVAFNEVVFHEDYTTHLEAKVHSAESTLSDAFLVKEQANHTAAVKEIIDAMVIKIKALSFIVNAAFRDDESLIKEFRLKSVSSFATSADSFIGFVTDLMVIVGKHKEPLAAKGLKEELLTEIKTNLESLQQKRHEQVEMMEKRPIFTQERITAMNTLWDEMILLRDASEVIFHNKAEVKGLFTLPKGATSSKATEEEIEEVEEAIEL